MTRRFLVFDSETVPDLEVARRMLQMADASDQEVRDRLRVHYARNGQATEDVFVKPVLQRIVALSVLQVDWSPDIGCRAAWLATRHTGTYSEAEIVQPFISLLKPRPIAPVLVGFNSRGFDLPLVQYRALALGIPAAVLHKRDGNTRDYFYRFGQDHIDLCETLSNYGAVTRPSLAELCAVCGIPVKTDGMSGKQVEAYAEDQRWREIGEYCETDVLALYLLFLRSMLVSGEMSPDEHAAAVDDVYRFIRERLSDRPYLAPFCP